MSASVIRTASEARQLADAARREGRRLALVPTMGFLHEGHQALIQEARRRADWVGVSVFVNPTQFGPSEDLSRYPRDLAGDVTKSDAAGADVVFAPEVSELYPPGDETVVEVTRVSQGLCGARRPGHFRGVATVVTKLFALFRPDLAVFGEKDYQQLQVIRALARDLLFGIEIVGVPTVRERDGVAKSSRNSYLSEQERGRAVHIIEGLRAARHAAENGASDAGRLIRAVQHELKKGGIREDYVELVDAESLAPLDRLVPGRPARLLVAGFVGTTRLIDNLDIPTPAEH